MMHIVTIYRDFGTSQYGKLQFTWTTQTPMEEVKVEDSGDQSTIPVETSKATDKLDKSYQKMWLRQHLLFPSLCKLRALDENKRLVRG